MEWSEFGSTLARAGLTGLSTALLGPAGPTVAGLVCGWLGLDADSPEAPAQAAQALADPRAVAELRMKEMECRVELAKLALAAETARLTAESDLARSETGRLDTVNLTMRAEAASERWPQYSWRPAWGFVSAAAFFAVCVFVCLIGHRAVVQGDMGAINMIPQLVGAFSWLFAIPGGILGVSAWKRGEEKIERARSSRGEGLGERCAPQ